MKKIINVVVVASLALGSVAIGWALKSKAAKHNLSDKDILNKGKDLVNKGVLKGKDCAVHAVNALKAKFQKSEVKPVESVATEHVQA